MGCIRILPEQVANQIAAGEVVERPASVVKELIENSLDAGATDLHIEVEGGGRRFIRVADNGSGMLRDDALLAFERHATSKLADAKDLLKIATLGFRGEALPSIASVSRLVLETRSASEQTGTRVEWAGGKLLKVEEIVRTPGTTVAVRDLFFNMPARRKFLRSEQTELAHIASLVTHYSLAHPDKAFTLNSGSRELLAVNPAGSLAERVHEIFGSRLAAELIEIPQLEREMKLPSEDPAQPNDSGRRMFKLAGFISRPQHQRPNRNAIYLFVNRRLIRDKLLLHAVLAAYHNLMPPACFPFVLLLLECDHEEVDVNVHPAKTEVRFRHASFVHDFVRDSIRSLLVQSRPASELPAAKPVVIDWQEQPAAKLPFSEFTQALQSEDWTAMDAAKIYAPALAEANETDLPLVDVDVPALKLAAETAPPVLRTPETHGEFPLECGAEIASLEALADLRPLGQLHNSFIIAAGTDGLWIIDQHVAHERILFEAVLRQMAAGKVEVQRLLLPHILELTPEQQVDFARVAGELEAAGFEIEPFGRRSVAIKAAPAGLAASEIEKVITEILEIPENELRRLTVDDLRRAVAASVACRAAIKVNTPLDQAKMEWLVGELARTSFPMSCPHGRPVALRYSNREILRGFRRI